MPLREVRGAGAGRKAPPGLLIPLSGTEGWATWALVMADTAHTHVTLGKAPLSEGELVAEP